VPSEGDEAVGTDRTRGSLNNALKDFREATDSDGKLHNLQKISQLVKDATDDELHELAAAAIVEEDYRVRGELCYTIQRSQRPELVEVLRGMTQDESSYVRHEAITAIGELSGIREATLAAIEPILDDVSKLKAGMNDLEEKLSYLRDSMEDSEGVDALSSGREIVMDDHMRCWETYLRHERELLQNHKGMYVAIYGEEILGTNESMEELAEIIYEKHGPVEALICRIEEEDGPIQMPLPRVILDL